MELHYAFEKQYTDMTVLIKILIKIEKMFPWIIGRKMSLYFKTKL